MISSKVSDILAHRFQRLTQPEISDYELISQLEQILEQERARKLPPNKTPQGFALPLFAGYKAHLNLM